MLYITPQQERSAPSPGEMEERHTEEREGEEEMAAEVERRGGRERR